MSAVSAGDVILYNTLAVTYSSAERISESTYLFIERVLSTHFLLYCKVRCKRDVWGNVSDAFMMFRDAEFKGPFLTFNMSINPAMILKNITRANRLDSGARTIQRAWRGSLRRPER